MAMPTWEDFEAGLGGSGVAVITAANLSLQANDVVVVFASHRNDYEGSESIVGLGATWTKKIVQNESDDSQVSMAVWIAQESSWGATDITVDAGTGKPVAAMACVVRNAKNFGGDFTDALIVGMDEFTLSGGASGTDDTDRPQASITTTSIDNLLLGGTNPRNKDMTGGLPVNPLDQQFSQLAGGNPSSYKHEAGSGGSAVEISVHQQEAPTAGTYTSGGDGAMSSAKDWIFCLIAIPGESAPAPPEIDVSPLSLNFPNTTVGQNSLTQDITVDNTGGSDLTLSSITLTGTNPGEFEITAGDSTPVVISGGGSHTITVRFTPSAAQASTANVQILSDDADEGTVNVSLSGTGEAAPLPLFEVDPADPFFYGNVITTGSQGQIFTVTNDGDAALTVNSVTLTGADSGEFNLVGGAGGFTVPSGGGTNTDTVLNFEPTLEQTSNAILTFNTAELGSFVVNVSGTGIAEALPITDGGITGSLEKNNESPKSSQFWANGHWWGVFKASTDGFYYLWRRETNGSWTRLTDFTINQTSSAQVDTYFDDVGGKAYILSGRPNNQTLQLHRLTYVPGSNDWLLDAGFPTTNILLNGEGERNFSIIKQSNSFHGTDVIFVFSFTNQDIRMNFSVDDGLSFNGSEVVVADATNDGLSATSANIDSEGIIYNGGGGDLPWTTVLIGENGGGKFFMGLLRGDLNAVLSNNWVPEEPDNSLLSDDHVSLRKGSDGKSLYALVKDFNDDIKFLKRAGVGGAWTTTDVPMSQSRPNLAVDEMNGDIYLFTADTSPAAGSPVYMRKGDEATLTFDPEVQAIVEPGHGFADPSTPQHLVDGMKDLLITTAEEVTSNEIWWGLVDIEIPPVTITPDDLDIGLTVDSPGLTDFKFTITPLDADLALTVDSPQVTQAIDIAPADLDLALTLDEATITEAADIAPADMAIGLTLDEAILTQENELVPSECDLVLTLDQAVLVQKHFLATNSADLALTLDEATIVQKSVIAPADLSLALTLDETDVNETTTISPAEASLALTLDEATILEKAAIAPNDLAIALTLDVATITEAENLSPDALSIGLTLDITSVVEKTLISPDELNLSLQLDQTGLTSEGVMSPENLPLQLSLDSPVITQKNVITAPDSNVGLTLDSATIDVRFTLAPAELSLGLSLDAATIDVKYSLAPDDLALALTLERPATEFKAALHPDGLSLTLGLDTAVIDVRSFLTPDALHHTLQLDSPGIASEGIITPDDLSLTLSAESPALPAKSTIAPDDLSIGLTADEAIALLKFYISPASGDLALTLDETATAVKFEISPDNLGIGVDLDSTDVTQKAIISPADLALSLELSFFTISQKHFLSPEDGSLNLMVDRPGLVSEGITTPLDLRLNLTVEQPFLQQKNIIAPDGLSIGLTLDNVEVDESTTIAPAELNLSLTLESPGIVSEGIIAPEPLDVPLTVESPAISQRHFMTPDGLNLALILEPAPITESEVIQIQPLNLALSLDETTVFFKPAISPDNLHLGLSVDSPTGGILPIGKVKGSALVVRPAAAAKVHRPTPEARVAVGDFLSIND